MVKNIKLMILGSLLLAPAYTQPAIFNYEQVQNTVSTIATMSKVKAGLGWNIESFQPFQIPLNIGIGLDGVKFGLKFKDQNQARFELAKAVVTLLVAGYKLYTYMPTQPKTPASTAKQAATGPAPAPAQ